MGNLAEIFAIACDECNGVGLVFWGNDLDYDVEKCDCRAGDLFTSGEAN